MQKSILKLSLVLFALATLAAFSSPKPDTDAKSKALIKALYKVNGGWAKLAAKKDVQYTYVYQDFNKKGTDLSTERYMFSNEASWAEYKQHEINVLPTMKGVAKQVVMNGDAKIMLGDKNIEDPQAIGGTHFLRVANFFWFTMMYKLDDPGTSHTYMGQEEINGINYDKVSLTYVPAEVGKDVNDEYILYFNPKTHLVDLFMFSIPAMEVMKPILKMELDYEEVDGVLIATSRRAFAPNGEGGFVQMGEYLSKDIKFGNKFTDADFKL